MMVSRNRRALYFCVGLIVGFGIIDWVLHQEFNIVKLLVSGVVGGAVYWLILKMQGR